MKQSQSHLTDIQKCTENDTEVVWDFESLKRSIPVSHFIFH